MRTRFMDYNFVSPYTTRSSVVFLSVRRQQLPVQRGGIVVASVFTEIHALNHQKAPRRQRGDAVEIDGFATTKATFRLYIRCSYSVRV